MKLSTFIALVIIASLLVSISVVLSSMLFGPIGEDTLRNAIRPVVGGAAMGLSLAIVVVIVCALRDGGIHK